MKGKASQADGAASLVLHSSALLARGMITCPNRRSLQQNCLLVAGVWHVYGRHMAGVWQECGRSMAGVWQAYGRSMAGSYLVFSCPCPLFINFLTYIVSTYLHAN
jgi:hypothetical protein